MTSTRRTSGHLLGVVACAALALVAANLVAVIFDVERVDPPGPGLIYVLVGLAAGRASTVLLGTEDDPT